MPKDKKLIIIDDEYDMGLVIKDFLDDHGIVTLIATDTSSGLEVVEKEKPDVVLLDVLIPQIGGVECLKRIRKISPDTIVIMMTGVQDERTARQALKSGAYDYVTKPFDLDYLKTNFLDRIFADDGS